MAAEILGLILLVLLVGANAVLSASKTALINARRGQLRELADGDNVGAARALDLAEGGVRLLATAQVAVVLTHFLMAGLVMVFVVPRVANLLGLVPALERIRFGLSYLLVLSLASLVLYLLGEMLPEVLALRYADRWVLPLSGAMGLAQRMLAPLVGGVTWAGNLLGSIGGSEEPANLPFVTEEEILTLVDAGEEEGVIELDEKQMIASIFKLDNTLVREVMVPRIDMVALPVETPLDEALDTIIQAGHSRIPVYSENIDQIAGLLYAKDLLEVWREGKTGVRLGSLLRPSVFVPESKKLDALLKELQSMKVHLAIVVDEYGGTAGLVTIEDIVEEIVGEIQDEYDSEEAIYQAVGDDEFEFDARIDIDDLNDVLESDLPTEMGDTLGGFIYSQLGKVPDPGEEVIADGLQLEVLSVDEQRIDKVRVRRLAEEELPGEQDSQTPDARD